MQRVIFIRSTIVGWPKKAPDGSVIMRKPGIPELQRHRGYVGTEADVPDDVAEELVRTGLARVFTEEGLSPDPREAAIPLQALPPPVVPDAAFAVHHVDEATADAMASAPYDDVPADDRGPRTQLRHRVR